MNSPSPKSLESDEALVFKASLTVYADQIVQIGVGPLVSRLTFASEQLNQPLPEPVVTIVMSTAGFVAMLKSANDLMVKPEVLKVMKQQLSDHMAVIDQLTKLKSD